MATKKPAPKYLTERPQFNYAALDEFLSAAPTQAEAPPEPRGMGRAIADTGLSFGQGAVQGVRMLTDLAGADNAVSTTLRSAEEFIGGLKSAQAKQDQQEIARILKDAEGAGVLDQVIAGAKAFGVAPVQTVAQALGTSVPTIAAAMIPGAGQAAVAGRMAGALGVGAGQGAGAVKGSIYDEVLQEQMAAGMPEAEARARAEEAQSYAGPNTGQIALGAGLGAAAGRFGVEGAVGRLARGSTTAAPGIAKRVGMGAAAEGIPEALQGGQEKFATNTALVNEGFDVDPMAGVVAGGTMEALAGAGMGAAFAIPRPGDALRADKVPERGPMTRALNEGIIEQAAKKVDAGAPLPAEPTAPGGPPPGQMATTFRSDDGELMSAGEVYGPGDTTNPVTGARIPAPPAEDSAAVAAARAQREADRPPEPTGDVLPGDILTKGGKPFKSMTLAMRELGRQGDGFELARVAEGLVIRKKASDGQPAGDAQPGAADGAGIPGDSSVDGEPAVQPGTDGNAGAAVDGAEPRSDAAGVRPGAAVPADALTGDLPTLKKAWGAAVAAGDTEGARRINDAIVAAKRKAQAPASTDPLPVQLPPAKTEPVKKGDEVQTPAGTGIVTNRGFGKVAVAVNGATRTFPQAEVRPLEPAVTPAPAETQAAEAAAPAAGAGAAAPAADLPGAPAAGTAVEGDGVATPKIGDMVKLTKPGLNGRVNIAGRVERILPDGRLEVRTQQDGFFKVFPSELGHKPKAGEAASQPNPAPALPDARREFREAMGKIDAVNSEWEALYRDALPYFSGDGPTRKLSPNAPDAIKQRYAAFKAAKKDSQRAYDEALAKVNAATPAAAPAVAPPTPEPEAPAPKPRQLNGSDAEKARALFMPPQAPAKSPDALRAELQDVERRILAAAPGRFSVGGGDVEAASKRKEVPAELKARRKALKEQLRATPATAALAPATHKDPGEPAEPVTPAVVAEAIKTAAKNEDRPRSEMKAEALRLVDEAIAKAPSSKDNPRAVHPDNLDEKERAAQYRDIIKAGKAKTYADAHQILVDKYVTATPRIKIKVPGDGEFTIINTKEKLREFRKQVESSPGFKDKLPTFPIGKATTSANLGPDGLAREMLDEGEPVNALEILDAAGKPMMFGNGNDGTAIPYTHSEAVEVGGFPAFVGRGWSDKKGGASGWTVINLKAGLAIGRGDTKAEAMTDAKKKLEDPKNAERLARAVNENKGADGKAYPTQEELRERFMTDAEGKQQATFNANDATLDRIAAGKKREADRDAAYQAIMGPDAKRPLGAAGGGYWSSEQIKAFLDRAEKTGKVDDALALLEDLGLTDEESSTGRMTAVPIQNWRKSYEARKPAADTGWKPGTAPGGLRRLTRKAKASDGTTYTATLDEFAGAYVTGTIKQEVDGTTRTVMSFSNDMDARAKADKFMDSVAQGVKPQAPASSPASAPAPAAAPEIPAGYKPAGEPYYKDGVLTQGYAKFAPGDRVRDTESRFVGVVDGPMGQGPMFDKLLVKFDSGTTMTVPGTRLEAETPAGYTLTIEMGGSELSLDFDIPVYKLTPDEVKAAVAARGFSSEKRGKYDPMVPWLEAHSKALEQAAKEGKRIPDKVLYERPGLIRDDLTPDQHDQAADAMVDAYRATQDYAKAVQAYREWGASAPAEPSAPAMDGPRRDPAQVNALRAPYNSGDIVTIGGQDWMVKSDTPGWYLSSDGTWRGEHPTIKGIKSQVEFIRAVEAAAQSAAPSAAEKAAPAKIEDVGEKIGGARKDTAVSTGPARKRGTEDTRPAWARRFQIAQQVTGIDENGENTGRWVIRDTRSLDWMKQPKQVGRSDYATKEEAEAFVPIAAVSMKHRVVMASTKKGDPDRYEIWRDITDRKRVKVVEQQFDSREDAMRYMVANAATIIETNTTFGEADLPLPPNRLRTGPDRRDGNVVGDDFKATFGFRGVEFGEWNNQDERQALMNDAWDGLMDLADVLGMPPKAIGLNGDLALAFGARGQGLQSARAHYESDRAVINLTKEKGAGSLAHEWFHALDHYFGRQDGKTPATWDIQEDGTRTLKAKGGDADMASGGFLRNKSGVRPEVRAAYEKLLTTMVKKAEVYVEDMAKVDKFTGQTREELAKELDLLRRDLSEQKDPKYWKRNNKPASAEVLAEFDGIAKAMLDGDVLALTSDWRLIPGGEKTKTAARWTNDSLERLSVLYKQVRGRTGFSAEKGGMLDRLRGYMTRYSQRLKMLADAQASTEKTRMVPTDFAMNARELDQGRGGDYWTTPHELAARAFQGYVEDKVAESGGSSRFLNYAPEGAAILTPWGFKRPYPAGQERKAINAEFDNLLDTIQTRTDDAGNVAMFSRARGRGISTRDAEAVVASIRAALPNSPDIVLLESVDKAPDELQDEIRAEGAQDDVEAVYWQGRIYAFPGNLESVERAAFVIGRHEVRHHGMRTRYGAKLDEVLLSMWRSNQELRQATQGIKDGGRAGQKETVKAIEEALADLPVERIAAMRGFDRLVATVRDWLRMLARRMRKAGLPTVANAIDPTTWTDNDIANFVLKAEQVSGVGAGPAAFSRAAEPAPATSSMAAMAGALTSTAPAQDDTGPRAADAHPGAKGAARFSRAPTADAVSALRDAIPPGVQDWITDRTTSQRGFNRAWHRTVGTQLHKAKINKDFGRVYNAVQDFMKDVSRMATLASEKAPDMLPQVETLGDLARLAPTLTSPAAYKQRKADIKAASDAMFDGTLRYKRDENGEAVKVEPDDGELGGLVWTDAELRERGVSERGIKMYRQSRAAIDQSLDNMLAADLYRQVSVMDPEMVAATPAEYAELLADLRRAAASESPMAVIRQIRAAMKDRLDGLEVALDGQPNQHTIGLMQRRSDLRALQTTIADKVQRIEDLKDNGYAPLMRFGPYAVDVLDGEGRRMFFGLYESQAAANQAARKFRGDGLSVSQSVVPQKDFEALQGVSPETAMLFAEMLGVEKNEAMQAWLKNAVAEQSALKRHIRRKGIEGFDEDGSRVLAAFLTSNARAASRALHSQRITEAVENVRQGDVKDEARALADYVNNPREEAQAIRSLLFVQYIGGSIASAIVNLTQTLVQTLPYLSQYGGAVKAGTRITSAMKLALAGKIPDPKLAAAVARAEKDGVIKPQEVFQLQAEASRSLGSNLYARSLLAAWGSMFQLAEQFNRRVAFIAAYNTAVQQGLGDPFKFAENAVDETQSVFNKGNRPDYGRGAVGATLLTFKTFTIQYLEFLKRLATAGEPGSPERAQGQKAAALALAMLILLSGMKGLPFADDADDLIDTVAQALGYNWINDAQRDRWLDSMLGEVFSDIVQHGLSGMPGVPFDVSQRLGMANLLPGTGLLKQSETRKQDQVLEVFGVAGSAVRDATQGEFRPLAIRNIAKGIDTYENEMYRDTKGRKVTEADAVDAVLKAIGLQPSVVARAQRDIGRQIQQRSLYQSVKEEITDAWAQARFENDVDGARKAQEALQRWNQSNPDARIVIQPQTIASRVRQMRLSKADRTIKNAPRPLRAQTAEALQ